jgi:hypothetical protein
MVMASSPKVPIMAAQDQLLDARANAKALGLEST